VNKKIFYFLTYILIVAVGANVQAGQILQSFNIDSLYIPDDNYRLEYSGCESININESLSLPAFTIYIETDLELGRENFYVPLFEQVKLGSVTDELASFRNITTGFDEEHEIVLPENRTAPGSAVYDLQYVSIDGRRYAAVTLLPVTLNASNELIFHSTVYLVTTEKVDKIKSARELAVDYGEATFIDRAGGAARVSVWNDIPLGCEYVIITSGALKPFFADLAEYKNACGISTAVVVVDSICRYYSGVDDAESVRNYLKDFYAGGGRYVLMGGDDVVLPVRYMFYYNTDVPPSDPFALRPSDLYFADLDGDWDADHDGIWGEPSDDAPDIVPELIVGRLPLRTAEAVQNYSDKLIEYETNPGGGDFDYLTRSLFFASDEMRDYPEEGQHGVIAGSLPYYVSVDTLSAVETPSGDHPTPTNDDGEACIDNLSGGYGFVHILAHGRIDGFLVKSANYGNWPASLILTAPQDANSHGSFSDLTPNGKTSLYYSLACDGGGYDLDTIDGESGSWSLVEKLISSEASGAVGMVANTRWGWVYLSYLLQESFTENLYGAAEGSPARAMYFSWLDFPYYYDLIYGQNYYGDPTLRIHTDRPERTAIELRQDYGDGIRLVVTADNDPLAEAAVTVSVDGAIIEEGFANADGEYIISGALENNVVYTVTASSPGCTVALDEFVASLTLDVDDDDDMLPGSFELGQNYPNPFNPATTIDYQIPVQSDVTLDIFNILGQRVQSLNIYNQSPGYHSIRWEGRNDDGQSVASGVYFYRLTAGEFRQTRKMYLIR